MTRAELVAAFIRAVAEGWSEEADAIEEQLTGAGGGLEHTQAIRARMAQPMSVYAPGLLHRALWSSMTLSERVLDELPCEISGAVFGLLGGAS